MKKQIAIVLGMSLAAGAAMANEGDYGQKDTLETGQPTAMSFDSLDVNQDSLVSEQEATDSQVLDSEAFASADTNQDGYLSRTEFDASVGGDTGMETRDPIELEDDAS